MGKLFPVANQITRLEQAFLQDNVRAFRNELRVTLALMEEIAGDNLPVKDEQYPGEGTYSSEDWL